MINNHIIKEAVRNSITKPVGLLSAEDLEKVESLDLSNSQITNENLRELSALKNLRDLCLDNTEITNDGLKELLSMKQLRNVSLKGTGITEADILTQRDSEGD